MLPSHAPETPQTLEVGEEAPETPQTLEVGEEAPETPQTLEKRPKCSRCKTHLAIPGRKMCLPCCTFDQERRWQAIDEGMCISCFKRPALEDNQRCLDCRDKMRADARRRYAKMKAKGMCTYCRHHRRMPHKLVCFGCAQKDARLEKAARERKRAEKETADVQELLGVEEEGHLLHLPDTAAVGES